MTPRPAVCTPHRGRGTRPTRPTPTGSGVDGNLNLLGSYEPFHPGNYPCPGAPCDVDFGATPVVSSPVDARRSSPPATRTATYTSCGHPISPPVATHFRRSAEHRERLAGQRRHRRRPRLLPEGRMLFVTDAGAGVPGVEAGIVGLAIQPDCTLAVAWSAHLGGNSDPNSTPTVANGVVYVGEGNDGGCSRSTPPTARRCEQRFAGRRFQLRRSDGRRRHTVRRVMGRAGGGDAGTIRAFHRAAADPRRCSETRASSHRSTRTRTASPRRSRRRPRPAVRSAHSPSISTAHRQHRR